MTEILKKTGSHTTEDHDGIRRSRKRIVARLLWELAADGEAVLPNGRRVMVEDVAELVHILKFLYQHIDGPARAELDVEHGGDLSVILNWGDTTRDDHDGDDA